ncbi:hypothetical protein OAH43_00375 [bacterium]|nr:hypothetical protein [bacterium]
MDELEKDMLEMAYRDFDKTVARHGEELKHSTLPRDTRRGTVEWVVNQLGRIILKFYYKGTGEEEIFHISSFIKQNRFGGIHIAWPCPDNPVDCGPFEKNRKLYIFLKHDWVFRHLGEGYTKNGALKMLQKFLETLIHYFRHNTRISEDMPITDERLKLFMNSCITKRFTENREEQKEENKQDIIYLLEQVNYKVAENSAWEGLGQGG